jgi:hypothetical protein
MTNSSRQETLPKISRLQLAVYLAYNCNGELYAIRSRPDPDMFPGAWALIDSLLQQMTIAASEYASEKYRAEVDAQVLAQTEDNATRDLLWAIRLNRSTK